MSPRPDVAPPADHHLAQVNVARMSAPLASPAMADFMALLEPINALADSSPGFIWRLQTDAGDATGIRAFPDERIIVNLSVWQSLQALWDFVYVSAHLEVMRRRRDWFQRMAESHTALWWVGVGTVPTVDEAKRRLDLLRARGPGADAFTFKTPFPQRSFRL